MKLASALVKPAQRAEHSYVLCRMFVVILSCENISCSPEKMHGRACPYEGTLQFFDIARSSRFRDFNRIIQCGVLEELQVVGEYTRVY